MHATISPFFLNLCPPSPWRPFFSWAGNAGLRTDKIIHPAALTAKPTDCPLNVHVCLGALYHRMGTQSCA